MIPDLNPALLMNYRAARSLKTRNTRIGFNGDSTFAGVETGGTTAQVLHSVPMQVAAKLQARGINAGANNRFGCASGTFATLLTMDSRVTATGAWTQGATTAQGGQAFACSAAGTLNIVPQGNVTKADIYWRDGAAGRSFNWSVDGGATTQIDSTGTTAIKKTTVSLGSSALHTFSLAWVAGAVTIFGVDFYDDTSSRRELSIQQWGISGATSANAIDDTDTVTGRLAQIKSGKALMTPDLMIIRLGVNDWRTSVSALSMVGNLTTLVTTCQANACDVILVTPRYDGGSTGLAAQQEDYANAIRALGPVLNVNVLDARAYFGSYALGNAAGWYSDTVHGDTGGAGYGEEAEFFVRALLTV
ncbi:GDSL-like lipase/acylhydrolase family protein [Bradyrhizobium stylosanthis]|uniref:GDSL-like lipase/acylhydrolase family protein n=2 Tax=Bradyrhizobium stylosanthis TaxID=1803665 RepID=A0A560CXM0_9BRAD|nr:GDSL-like lipase/acylhydrolase family protein [Bradyrhizobium stylosanthis]